MIPKNIIVFLQDVAQTHPFLIFFLLHFLIMYANVLQHCHFLFKEL